MNKKELSWRFPKEGSLTDKSDSSEKEKPFHDWGGLKEQLAHGPELNTMELKLKLLIFFVRCMWKIKIMIY